jgi:hypothetical protein
MGARSPRLRSRTICSTCGSAMVCGLGRPRLEEAIWSPLSRMAPRLYSMSPEDRRLRTSKRASWMAARSSTRGMVKVPVRPAAGASWRERVWK